jgi:MoxR-like ATPase
MSESQLAGWLLPVKANGRFGYVPAPFVIAYTEGGVFLLDEMDNGDANVLTFMNAALSNGHMFIPQKGVDGDSMVKRHPDFICVAAANTFGTGPDAQYVGRNKLDAATLNRFASQRIYLDYSEAVEMSVTSKRVYVWAKAIRDEIRSRRIRRIMSTRNMIDFTEQEQSGNKLLKDVRTWEDSFFADWKEDERRAVQQAGRQALKDELGEEVPA